MEKITVTQGHYALVFNDKGSTLDGLKLVEDKLKLVVIQECSSMIKCRWIPGKHIWIPRIFTDLKNK